ncbi:MAG: hypothetical protein IJO79_03570 [Firmicutes bacterium]|nr:hypothetical protein [Bacillota bacterium]
MKQIIVLVAMIVLGIAIAGFVMNFQTSAQTISSNASTAVTSLFAGKFPTN